MSRPRHASKYYRAQAFYKLAAGREKLRILNLKTVLVHNVREHVVVGRVEV